MSGVLLDDSRSLYSAQMNHIMFLSHLSDTTIQLKERLANDVAPRMRFTNSICVLTIATYIVELCWSSTLRRLSTFHNGFIFSGLDFSNMKKSFFKRSVCEEKYSRRPYSLCTVLANSSSARRTIQSRPKLLC